jgi:DNA mismatch repair protein MSH4
VPSTAANPPSKLFYILEENQDDINANLTTVDRRYFAETAGLESINKLAFPEDVEAIKVSIGGNFFAVCCFAAVRLNT